MKLIDVYPYRIINKHVSFLLLKRSAQKIYSNQWRMIGGKVESGETAWKAALRELKEETGFSPHQFWAVPSINQFYDPNSDTIHQIPVFACEIKDHFIPELNEEHIDYKWLTIDEIDDIVRWPEQKRLIFLINDILKYNLPKEWLISLASA